MKNSKFYLFFSLAFFYLSCKENTENLQNLQCQNRENGMCMTTVSLEDKISFMKAELNRFILGPTKGSIEEDRYYDKKTIDYSAPIERLIELDEINSSNLEHLKNKLDECLKKNRYILTPLALIFIDLFDNVNNVDTYNEQFKNFMLEEIEIANTLFSNFTIEKLNEHTPKNDIELFKSELKSRYLNSGKSYRSFMTSQFFLDNKEKGAPFFRFCLAGFEDYFEFLKVFYEKNNDEEKYSFLREFAKKEGIKYEEKEGEIKIDQESLQRALATKITQKYIDVINEKIGEKKYSVTSMNKKGEIIKTEVLLASQLTKLENNEGSIILIVKIIEN